MPLLGLSGGGGFLSVGSTWGRQSSPLWDRPTWTPSPARFGETRLQEPSLLCSFTGDVRFSPVSEDRLGVTALLCDLG